MSPARQYLLVLLAMGAAALGCVVLSGASWATLDLAGTLDTTTVTVTGRDVVPGANALGWAALAAVVAVHASRRLGRVVIGTLLATGGLFVAGTAAVTAADLPAAATESAQAQGDGVPTVVATTEIAAWAMAGAGIVVALAGAACVAFGHGWPGLARRYDRHKRQTTPTGGDVTARDVWNALDRGDDPTSGDHATWLREGDQTRQNESERR